MMPPRDVNTAQAPRKAGQARRDPELVRAREQYKYRTERDNQLHPICISKEWPASENYKRDWIVPLLPRIVPAWINFGAKSLQFELEKAAFRFDKSHAYDEILYPWDRPVFSQKMSRDTRDAFFGYCRVGGANPLLLRCERNLEELQKKIPIDTDKIEERLRRRCKGISLAEQAADCRLFSVDFKVNQSSIRNERTRDSRERDTYVTRHGHRDGGEHEDERTGNRHDRDSRWREKYLPAPIGVFLDAPGFYREGSLVPLAIQIDQTQPAHEPNPVYYPDNGWGWRIAQLYFEAADVSFNSACGHVLRTHLTMEPFCMATARQLSGDHRVRVLLEPHTRYTLVANKGAYESFVDRSKTYYKFYSGTLDEQRQIAIESFRASEFYQLALEADLQDRGVRHSPSEYPYRNDALRWRDVIRDFVAEYIRNCYSDDAAVRRDRQLQSWFAELRSENGGRLKGLVPPENGRESGLDTVPKLIDLLAQVLFIAGPQHASQHYTSTYYYRYAPVFPGAAYNPPLWRGELAHEARFLNTLPPIGTANLQFTYNTFLEYRYGKFGHYQGYQLAGLREAAAPIAHLRAALAKLEIEIGDREQERRRNGQFPYDFLLPSRVPNSINL
jgi:arachidonate 15-lipoxygenase